MFIVLCVLFCVVMLLLLLFDYACMLCVFLLFVLSLTALVLAPLEELYSEEGTFGTGGRLSNPAAGCCYSVYACLLCVIVMYVNHCC